MHIRSIRPSFIAAVCFLLLAAGCGPRDTIRRYPVRKPPPTHRLLGAIVRQAEKVWFFKVVGPNKPLEAQADAFQEFIRSLRFTDDPESPVEWTLPDGWEQAEGSEFRYATITMGPPGDSLELSVSHLPFVGEDETAYVLSNVNRWRGQLGVRSIGLEQLADNSEEIPLNAPETLRAVIVNVTGRSQQASMGASRDPHAQQPPPAPQPELKYATPAGWAPGDLVVSRGGIEIRRPAAFEVKRDDQRVEITVTRLPEVAGELTMNVNRWRGQVQLDSLSSEQIEEDAETVTVGDTTGEYFKLFGPQEAILGVIAKREGLAWFIKLQGSRQLAEQEQANFEAFVKSLEF